MKEISLGIAIALLLPIPSFAKGMCKTMLQSKPKLVSREYEGDNGSKFIQIRIQYSENKDSNNNHRMEFVAIENRPNTSPMFHRNFIFTRNIATTKASYRKIHMNPPLIVESHFPVLNGVLMLEAEGLLFRIHIAKNGELYFIATIKNSGLSLPDAILLPSRRTR